MSTINFNKGSIFNLKPIEEEKIRPEVYKLLIEGEAIIAGFRTIRDQLVFTDKRIIAINVQGITGMRKSYSTLPYSRIQYFTVQTEGFLEVLPDCELMLHFSNGFEAEFEFSGSVEIGIICNAISKYVLEDR